MNGISFLAPGRYDIFVYADDCREIAAREVQPTQAFC
jgi:hypothetical protein